MKELIKVIEKDGELLVSARDLYSYLSVDDGSHFTRWSKSNIEDMFTQNVDYETLRLNGGGRPSLDYALKLDVAKEISMMSRCENGKKARQYFIECEKTLKLIKSVPQFNIPKTLSEALRLAADQQDIIEKQTLELQENNAFIENAKPKLFEYEVLMDSDVAISIGQFSKMLQIGRNNIFELMRKKKILISGGREHNLPYQKFIDAGYFEVIETTITPKEGTSFIKQQTLVTPKGQSYLLNKLIEV